MYNILFAFKFSMVILRSKVLMSSHDIWILKEKRGLPETYADEKFENSNKEEGERECNS